MARELVLIPKTKYEHLLRLTEEKNNMGKENKEQSGGQLDSQILTNNADAITSVPKNEQARELTTMDSDLNQNVKEEKAKFYVDKPLERMPFKSKLLTPKRKRAPQRHSKKVDASTDEIKKSAKWINYVV